jgi:CheY-like chemotaxis protein
MDERVYEGRAVLLVTAMAGAENLAKSLSEGAGVVLEVARSRRAALASLRRQMFVAIIVDTELPANEVTSTEMLWQNGGVAVPLELDLRALGSAALTRLLRSMLERRNEMEAIVREEVTRSMAEELRSTVTGMLLQSDLALRDQNLSPVLERRVRELRAMADDLRLRLRAA